MTHLSGHVGHGAHAAKIEGQNWWGLGLIGYWRHGKVVAMGNEASRYYMVTKSRGYGPLALPFVFREQATYNAEGTRESYMMNASILWGHMAMAHHMGSRLSGGQWMGHTGVGVFHHMVNVGVGHGGGSVSFFSAPNPFGFGQ